MARKSEAELAVCLESFVTVRDGADVHVTRGEMLRDDDPIARDNPAFFEATGMPSAHYRLKRIERLGGPGA